MTRGKNYMDTFLSKIVKKGLLFTASLSLLILLLAKPLLYLIYGNETANYSEILIFMSFLGINKLL